MKFLILGHTGFVGKNLMTHLTNLGHDVAGVSTEGCDLREYDNVARILQTLTPLDAVFNCAANVGSVHYVTKYAADVITDNTQMALNLYKAVTAYAPETVIINPLSNCCYADGSLLQDEREWLSGPVHHSVFSFGNFKRVLYYISKCYDIQHGTRTVNLMLPGIYGPGDSTDPNKVHALNGMIIRMLECQKEKQANFEIWGTGEPVREWIYIDDVCKIMTTAAENTGDVIEPINIAQGDGSSIKQTAEFIATALEFDGELTFNTDYQDGAAIKILKTGKFTETFGDFDFYDHQEGIRNTVDYYREVLYGE